MRKFLIAVYCFPFVYFAMYQDFANRSMIGYLIMIITTSLLALNGRTTVILAGNVASALISSFFISRMTGDPRWGGYFKPLSPNQLLIVVTLLNLIPQFIAMKLAKKRKPPTSS
ncbi:hypothetical protein LC040_12545 [Bacillus tianshenii]|nr:hypothetical protein LC040_12545 [Bacillus tianshenii]